MKDSKLSQAEALFEKEIRKVKEDIRLQSTEVLEKTLETFDQNPAFQALDTLQKHFWKEILVAEITERKSNPMDKRIH